MQLDRRILYGLFGVLPALGAACSAFVLGLMQFWSPSLFGVSGLAWAALELFPISNRTYKRIVPLVTLGLISVAWFGALAVAEFGRAIADGDREATAWNLGLLCAAVVVLVGPAACATHFVLRSRRTPNNSFKPKPLRGSA